jgi:ankyrin repeat protein
MGPVAAPATAVLAVMFWLASADVNRAGEPERLFQAAKAGDVAAVLGLLDRGTPVDCIEPGSQMTPLMYAAALGRLDAARLLLSRGASLTPVTPGCGTPLAHAARGGDAEMVRLLLAQGADPNACNPQGFSPTMCAAAKDNVEAVDSLLAGGANINAADDYGQTALIVAAGTGSNAALKRLLVAGADLRMRDLGGGDAATTAERERNEDGAALLRAALAPASATGR